VIKEKVEPTTKKSWNNKKKSFPNIRYCEYFEKSSKRVIHSNVMFQKRLTT
jgi:hypothetical protein